MRWVCQGRDGYAPDMGPEWVGLSGCGCPPPTPTFYTQDRWGCQNIALTPLGSCTWATSEILLTFEIYNWTNSSTTDPKQLQLITFFLFKWVIMTNTNLRNNHAVLVLYNFSDFDLFIQCHEFSVWTSMPDRHLSWSFGTPSPTKWPILVMRQKSITSRFLTALNYTRKITSLERNY